MGASLLALAKSIYYTQLYIHPVQDRATKQTSKFLVGKIESFSIHNGNGSENVT